MSVLAIEGLRYRYPEASAALPSGARSDRRAGRVRGPRRPLGVGQVDPAAGRLRPRAALPRRRDRGRRSRSPASTPSQHGPGELAAARRLRRPGPRDPGRLHHRRGGDRAAAGDARRVRTPPAPAPSRRSPSPWRSRTCSTARVDTLSGGELQRVALAAALVTRPELVLLDEPTSQLDPVAGDELIWLLRRLNEEWGVAILLCRAPARALPRGRRPGRRDGRRRASPSTAPRPTSSPGPSDPTRRWRPRGPALLDLAGHRSRCPSGFAMRADPARRSARGPARRRQTVRGSRPTERSGRRRPVRAGRACAVSRSLGRARAAARSRRTSCKGIDLEIDRGETRCADGPQRRRQEHPAAGGRGPARAGRAAGSRRRAGSRC